jgi:hypothetical protein
VFLKYVTVVSGVSLALAPSTGAKFQNPPVLLSERDTCDKFENKPASTRAKPVKARIAGPVQRERESKWSSGLN